MAQRNVTTMRTVRLVSAAGSCRDSHVSLQIALSVYRRICFIPSFPKCRPQPSLVVISAMSENRNWLLGWGDSRHSAR
jgi:hypothetical protein